MPGITTCLWFDTEAEEAAEYYIATFRACGRPASLGGLVRYGAAGPGPEGSVMTADFALDGNDMLALNGGPIYKHTPAMSLIVKCRSQAEINGFWNRLVDGGKPSRCGWLTDRFGVSWQIVPAGIVDMMHDPDAAKRDRVVKAFMPMEKLDLRTIERAYDGDRGAAGHDANN